MCKAENRVELQNKDSGTFVRGKQIFKYLCIYNWVFQKQTFLEHDSFDSVNSNYEYNNI